MQPTTPISVAPGATTILGSARLSGKVGPWSIGVLGAVTSRETASVRSSTGATDDFVVEPRANYFVGRARRELRQGQSFVGAVLTSVQRDLVTDAVLASLHRSALDAGVDFARDRHSLLHTRPDYVVVLKVIYWVNP